MQPIILAGGIGSRLWPISSCSCPKQFIKFDGKSSFFQKTIIRFNVFDKPIIIANIDHKEIIIQQLEEIAKDCILILEPLISNTYIPFLIGVVIASRISLRNIGFFPSDHYISSMESFYQTIDLADLVAQDNLIVAIGVKADHINDQYGHIISHSIFENIHKCVGFIEKPNHLECRFLENLRHKHDIYWNSGIYLGSQNFFMTHFNDSLSIINNILPSLEKGIILLPEILYTKIQQGSFDKIFMSQLTNFYMIQSNFQWLDIGNYTNLQSYTMQNRCILKK